MKKWFIRFSIAVIWAATLFYAFGFGTITGTYMPENTRWTNQQALALLSTLPGEVKPCDQDDTTLCGQHDPRGREAQSCAPFTTPNPRHAVLFTFGQSNAANSGPDRFTAKPAVANFSMSDGKCYRATDPLLGADGSGGSVWGHVGDRLIETGRYDRVLIVAVGIGGSNIARWTKEGDLNPRIRKALDQLKTAGIRPTHILWHQGEADRMRGTGTEDYIEAFGSIVQTFRDLGFDAPLFPAIATHCNMFGQSPARHEEGMAAVRMAQQQLPQRFAGVRPGPDTDQITGLQNRYDDCHFTHTGMAAHADLWVQAIMR